MLRKEKGTEQNQKISTLLKEGVPTDTKGAIKQSPPSSSGSTAATSTTATAEDTALTSAKNSQEFKGDLASFIVSSFYAFAYFLLEKPSNIPNLSHKQAS